MVITDSLAVSVIIKMNELWTIIRFFKPHSAPTSPNRSSDLERLFARASPKP